MHMLYNSDSYVVVRFDMPDADAAADAAPAPSVGGFEIVDKAARKEIFIVGAVAAKFQQGVQALAEHNPTEEQFDDYIAGYTTLAQQPLALH